mmetsp:Transcript_16429/g.23371  ORF Transcript_16429/g.23371 Transcript_16429/m.23371 type:complete len:91 (+) Transcript_16429:125-397(+)
MLTFVGVFMSADDLTFNLSNLRRNPWCNRKFLKPARKLLLKQIERRKACFKLTISELIKYLKEHIIIDEIDDEYIKTNTKNCIQTCLIMK